MGNRRLKTRDDAEVAGDVPDEAPRGLDAAARQALRLGVTITDPSLEDNPLVFVNRAFVRMTGYAPRDCIGRNCRFLQGSAQDQPGVHEIRAALAARREVSVDLVNFRADGDRFINRLMIAPLFWEDGELAYFLGVQSALPEGVSDVERLHDVQLHLAELQHRVKNHLAMIVGMIRREARDAGDAQSRLEVFATRVEALSLLYDQVDRKGLPHDTARLDAYLGRVCSALADLSPSPGIALTFYADPATLPVEEAAQVGLLLSECVTNAMKHAFEERAHGRIEVTLEERSTELVLTIEDDGIGFDPGQAARRGRGLGARIMRSLARRLDADLVVSGDRKRGGTAIRIGIPRSG